MIPIPGDIRIWLAKGRTDMRENLEAQRYCQGHRLHAAALGGLHPVPQ